MPLITYPLIMTFNVQKKWHCDTHTHTHTHKKKKKKKISLPWEGETPPPTPSSRLVASLSRFAPPPLLKNPGYASDRT